jgi:two-component system, NtrC family, response regulator HydG
MQPVPPVSALQECEMAGSQTNVSVQPDQILAARIEALQLLAEGSSDRIMVIGADQRVLYANQAAWSGAGHASPPGRPAKCYEAFLQQSNPCVACSARAVFEATDVRAVSCSTHGDGNACGMKQAYPLLAGDQRTGAVLVLLNGATWPSRPPKQTAVPHVGDLIGLSAPMQQLGEMIKLVADSQATVLLQGESGTGKELAARTIHQLSYRRDQPFIVVDCGSLPETLLESELFGHVKGAFTGAHATKKGLFEEATGGTIFLDEIADTSPQFQAKLLRVLQEGEIKPVGSNRTIKVDVRVISATNKDLTALIKAKAFREDLYYRLAVLPLMMPPLRDRRDDIPLLVAHFVAAACRRHRRPAATVTPEAMHALTDAAWPGNVRELQHAVERAVVTAQTSRLAAQDFFTTSETASNEGAGLRSIARTATQRAERARIEQALHDTGGNKMKAAALLKISRAGLYNKLRGYGIA